MSSKRVTLGFLSLLAVAIVASLLNPPHASGGRLLDSAQFNKGHDRDGDGDRDHDGDDADLAKDDRVKRGLEIAPVPLHFDHKQRNLVGLGAYLVNATGGCNDCHTCPPYQPADDPFTGGSGHPNAANYLAGGQHFGPFVSRNLTPKNGLPAGLTLEQFIHAIRTGEDPEEPGELLQVMPWPVFRNLTDRDLRAIYAYLSAIPPAQPGSCDGPSPSVRAR